MAKVIGRALAGGRRIPSMEYALSGLLFAMAILGSLTDLDMQVRMAVGSVLSDMHSTTVLLPK